MLQSHRGNNSTSQLIESNSKEKQVTVISLDWNTRGRDDIDHIGMLKREDCLMKRGLNKFCIEQLYCSLGMLKKTLTWMDQSECYGDREDQFEV